MEQESAAVEGGCRRPPQSQLLRWLLQHVVQQLSNKQQQQHFNSSRQQHSTSKHPSASSGGTDPSPRRRATVRRSRSSDRSSSSRDGSSGSEGNGSSSSSDDNSSSSEDSGSSSEDNESSSGDNGSEAARSTCNSRSSSVPLTPHRGRVRFYSSSRSCLAPQSLEGDVLPKRGGRWGRQQLSLQTQPSPQRLPKRHDKQQEQQPQRQLGEAKEETEEEVVPGGKADRYGVRASGLLLQGSAATAPHIVRTSRRETAACSTCQKLQQQLFVQHVRLACTELESKRLLQGVAFNLRASRKAAAEALLQLQQERHQRQQQQQRHSQQLQQQQELIAALRQDAEAKKKQLEKLQQLPAAQNVVQRAKEQQQLTMHAVEEQQLLQQQAMRQDGLAAGGVHEVLRQVQERHARWCESLLHVTDSRQQELLLRVNRLQTLLLRLQQAERRRLPLLSRPEATSGLLLQQAEQPKQQQQQQRLREEQEVEASSQRRDAGNQSQQQHQQQDSEIAAVQRQHGSCCGVEAAAANPVAEETERQTFVAPVQSSQQRYSSQSIRGAGGPTCDRGPAAAVMAARQRNAPAAAEAASAANLAEVTHAPKTFAFADDAATQKSLGGHYSGVLAAAEETTAATTTAAAAGALSAAAGGMAGDALRLFWPGVIGNAWRRPPPCCCVDRWSVPQQQRYQPLLQETRESAAASVELQHPSVFEQHPLPHTTAAAATATAKVPGGLVFLAGVTEDSSSTLCCFPVAGGGGKPLSSLPAAPTSGVAAATPSSSLSRHILATQESDPPAAAAATTGRVGAAVACPGGPATKTMCAAAADASPPTPPPMCTAAEFSGSHRVHAEAPRGERTVIAAAEEATADPAARLTPSLCSSEGQEVSHEQQQQKAGATSCCWIPCSSDQERRCAVEKYGVSEAQALQVYLKPLLLQRHETYIPPLVLQQQQQQQHPWQSEPNHPHPQKEQDTHQELQPQGPVLLQQQLEQQHHAQQSPAQEKENSSFSSRNFSEKGTQKIERSLPEAPLYCAAGDAATSSPLLEEGPRPQDTDSLLCCASAAAFSAGHQLRLPLATCVSCCDGPRQHSRHKDTQNEDRGVSGVTSSSSSLDNSSSSTNHSSSTRDNTPSISCCSIKSGVRSSCSSSVSASRSTGRNNDSSSGSNTTASDNSTTGSSSSSAVAIRELPTPGISPASSRGTCCCSAGVWSSVAVAGQEQLSQGETFTGTDDHQQQERGALQQIKVVQPHMLTQDQATQTKQSPPLLLQQPNYVLTQHQHTVLSEQQIVLQQQHQQENVLHHRQQALQQPNERTQMSSGQEQRRPSSLLSQAAVARGKTSSRAHGETILRVPPILCSLQRRQQQQQSAADLLVLHPHEHDYPLPPHLQPEEGCVLQAQHQHQQREDFFLLQQKGLLLSQSLPFEQQDVRMHLLHCGAYERLVQWHRAAAGGAGTGEAPILAAAPTVVLSQGRTVPPYIGSAEQEIPREKDNIGAAVALSGGHLVAGELGKQQ